MKYKLKDDVDLHELKKYGFQKENNWFYARKINNKWWDTINVSTDEDKEIYRATDVVGYSEIDYDIEVFIDDLIKAGLVDFLEPLGLVDKIYLEKEK